MRRFLLPLLFLVFFVFESIFVELLPEKVFNSEQILVPHFLIIAILFLAIYGDKKQGIIYGLVFGLLFDIVYTELLGIYLFMFPLVVYIVGNIMRILQSNIVVVIIVSIIGVALLELGVYELYYLINITSMNFSMFAESRLLPTLIFNLVITILLAYPLKKYFEKYAAELKKD